ncbi:27 kDa glycoprotein-like [Eurosta solidaginis]|uniref:27 kDa glycoprotein-like n=1 Tax=Eurosta solidaginis TaxID=178769 RepID=UPI0035316818
MQRSMVATILLSIALFITVISNNVYADPSAVDIDLSQINVNDLQKRLPPEFANTNLTLDDAKALVRDKCIQAAGGDKEKGEAAYVEMENALVTLMDCATNILNFTVLEQEIKEEGPKGELDVVFNKYCNKQPEALSCVEAFNSKLSNCLDQEEKQHQDVFMRIVRSLLSFICHKGGDQIALFIAEKGPECLQSKAEDIQNCVNSTFSSYLPKNGFEDFKALPKFVISPKQCEEMAKLEHCIVQKLEKCSEITPANIVESMFRFIKNETICHNTQRVTKQALVTSGGSSFVIQQLNIIWGLLCGSLIYIHTMHFISVFI